MNIIGIRFWLFLLLIVLAPLSKYPSFSLPILDFSSFRIGLYQVMAAIFVALCIMPALKSIKMLYQNNKIAFVAGLTLVAVIISGIVLAIDKQRAVLLGSSFLMLLALAASAWWYVSTQLRIKSFEYIIRYVIIFGIIFSALGILEFVLITLTSFDLKILCTGCLANIFGFPRINLFAAEPQFYANSLLPFLFISIAWFYHQKSQAALYCICLTSLAIVLTFSRGAYLAAAAGYLIWVVLLVILSKINIKRLVTITITGAISALIGLLMLVWSATVINTSANNIAYETIDTIAEHLTLKLIDLPEKPAPIVPTQLDEVFVSPGLIESSGQERLGAADLAIKAWANSNKNILLGTGIGNLGPYVVKHIQTDTPYNLTVYIYYVLLLAELGLIGLIAFMAINLSAFVKLFNKYKKDKNWAFYSSLLSLLAAFLIQYLFFGTTINVVYVWLWTGIILGLGVANSLKTNK